MALFFRIFCLYLCAIALPCAADLAADTVYLTWQRSPSTTMTIQWISPPEQAQSRLFFKGKSDSDWHEVKDVFYRFPQSTNYFFHRVELKGLKPASEYVFRLNDDPQQYFFKTMPEKIENSIRFVVGGDMYHDGVNILTATNKQAALFNPSFAIVGGDIAYASPRFAASPQKVDRWLKWVECWHKDMVTKDGFMIPVIAAIGNHDVSGNYNQTPAQAQIFSMLFPMPGAQIYNALDFGNYLSIFLLDSGHANPVSGKQADWLKEALQTHANTTHRFAAYHVPAYSSVRSNGRISMDIRRYWVPHFEKGGIQTAFEHHDHAYKRTFPLLNDKIHPNGIVYLGDGAWGVAKPRNPKTSKRKRYYIDQFASKRHFIGVILEPNQQTFISIDPNGKVIDEYSRKIISLKEVEEARIQGSKGSQGS